MNFPPAIRPFSINAPFTGTFNEFFLQNQDFLANTDFPHETRLRINEILFNGEECNNVIDPANGLLDIWFLAYKSWMELENVLVVTANQFNQLELATSDIESQHIIQNILVGRPIQCYDYIAVGIFEVNNTHLSCAIGNVRTGAITYFNPAYYSLEEIQRIEADLLYDRDNIYYSHIADAVGRLRMGNQYVFELFYSYTSQVLYKVFHGFIDRDWTVQPLVCFPNFLQPFLSCACAIYALFFIDAMTRPNEELQFNFFHLTHYEWIVNYVPRTIIAKKILLYFLVSGRRFSGPFTVNEMLFLVANDLVIVFRNITRRTPEGFFYCFDPIGYTYCIIDYFVSVYYFLKAVIMFEQVSLNTFFGLFRGRVLANFTGGTLRDILESNPDARGLLQLYLRIRTRNL